MKGGWLEHEIRSLPQVLACSITSDDVVVLVQPSADPGAVERAAQEVLRRAGVDLPIRVFGGDRPVFVQPVAVRSGRTALVGSIGAAAILAAGMWLAGATVGLRNPGSKGRAPAASLAPPVATELVTVPVVGGAAPAETPQEEPPLPPLLRPASPPLFGVVGIPKLPRLRPPAVEPPAVQPPAVAACQGPPDRGAPWDPHGRHLGDGPPSWSHSVLVPPHCGHGRPR